MTNSKHVASYSVKSGDGVFRVVRYFLAIQICFSKSYQTSTAADVLSWKRIKRDGDVHYDEYDGGCERLGG